MTSAATWTRDADLRLREYLATHQLSQGVGNEESACSVAAINLALTGTLTDRIPECMSLVIGRWIIRVQDAMPSELRNSREWRDLLPLAAGTGRGHEAERAAVALGWMWDALALIQPVADERGFGAEWRKMCEQRAALAAADAAYAAAYADDAADAAYAAAHAAADAAAAYAAADFWVQANPAGCLRRMIDAGGVR